METIMTDETTEDGVLNLQDLLIDEQADELSEYLSLSMESIDGDTVVSVTTVEEHPTTYSSTINGVALTDMHYLVDASIDPVGE